MNPRSYAESISVGGVGLAPRRILVVDDDEDTLHAIAALLSEDYEVATASDGIAGLEAAIREAPHLVIADVRMPRADGVTMVCRMKQIDSLHSVPVIFLSGETSVQSFVAGISAGARAYLPKPIDPALLRRKVRSALTPQA